MAPYEPVSGPRFYIRTPAGKRALDLVANMRAIAQRNRRLRPKPHAARNARHGRPRGR